MSGGLAKACVPRKNYSVPEKLEFPTEISSFLSIHAYLMESFCVQSFQYTSCHMSLASNSDTLLLSFSSVKTSDIFLDLYDVQRSDL